MWEFFVSLSPKATTRFSFSFQMAGMKLLSITNITVVAFIVYLCYTANTFYAMFRLPTCRTSNCISSHIKPSSHQKIKVDTSTADDHF